MNHRQQLPYETLNVKFVSYRKGRIAQIARWLHRHTKNRLAYRLGYLEWLPLPEPRILGTALNDAQRGEVLKIDMSKMGSFTIEYYPHKWNEN